MDYIKKYLVYIRTVRRYSPRTAEIYEDILGRYCQFCNLPPEQITKAMTVGDIRDYQVHLSLEKKLSAKTSAQHMSVLSGFAAFLIREGALDSNPVSLVGRPKIPKRLPSFYRESSMQEYFEMTDWKADTTLSHKDSLHRLVISLLYSTGIRRSELISLKIGSVDFSRNVLHVRGKGNKMREIPIISSLSKEILLYLQATESLLGRERTPEEPLLVTEKGKPLYPVAVERIVGEELALVPGIAGRKSPHVLRHTIATELLEKGADLNSIKELLGHSSLAATQVYTHNSIGKLKNVYNNAHPRAKRGGKNGD